ncbi:hypothetical protein DIURU_005776 [Diutina rugosa]|uniref:Uncharacterized protein n=1 Tax=Diutina rugosa TaxID=5481 RepID=A0A642UC23_DIURU|nr:uncharacterized protein DIURU_005776 [Diutina rugosa]KAA8896510.1 hypothetical protein DIURU_005776 [Diutina rugosa]
MMSPRSPLPPVKATMTSLKLYTILTALWLASYVHAEENFAIYNPAIFVLAVDNTKPWDRFHYAFDNGDDWDKLAAKAKEEPEARLTYNSEAAFTFGLPQNRDIQLDAYRVDDGKWDLHVFTIDAKSGKNNSKGPKAGSCHTDEKEFDEKKQGPGKRTIFCRVEGKKIPKVVP